MKWPLDPGGHFLESLAPCACDTAALAMGISPVGPLVSILFPERMIHAA
jgi:hypothetical protein